MRHSKTEKAKTHERIVAVASKKFREEGLAGIGIADLMKEAGLTVGGFYKHFKSRDALVAEAVGSSLDMWKDRIDAAAAGGPPHCGHCRGWLDCIVEVSAFDSIPRLFRQRPRSATSLNSVYSVTSPAASWQIKCSAYSGAINDE